MRTPPIAMLLFAVLPASAQSHDPAPYKISVDVNLVVLNATVRDRKGRMVSDLQERDFEIYEEGVRQSIRLFRHEDIPVSVGLVIDHSTSMREKLPEVIAAARTFVQTSNPEDRMFVVNFNEKVTLGLRAGAGWSNRAEDLEQAISGTPAEGMTALYDAVAVALDRLRAGDGKKVLIVISDGGDNASRHTLAEALKMAEASAAMVYTIGIFGEHDEDRNPDVLRRLARVTGGETYVPRELKEVVAICERIARDIRHQYTLGYVPSAAATPGVYRAIRVAAGGTADGKLLVRARSGYIAGGQK